jgi:hypothetical protein
LQSLMERSKQKKKNAPKHHQGRKKKPAVFSAVPEQTHLDVLDSTKDLEYFKQHIIRKDLEEGKSYILYNVLTKEECAKFIEICEEKGFALAGLAIGKDQYRVNLDVRNNKRVMFDDPDLADKLWKRVEHLIIPEYKDCKAKCLNWRFRVYKYEVGEKFAPHHDQTFPLPRSNDRTLFSFMIYLNEGFEGGETTFFEEPTREYWNQKETEKNIKPPIKYVARPQTGMCVVFDHYLFHEGSEVTQGVKYAVRSDVFYTPFTEDEIEQKIKQSDE